MRAMIIASVFLLICIVPWAFYDNYAEEALEDAHKILMEETIPLVNDTNFNAAKEKFGEFIIMWEDYKVYATFFINRGLLNDVEDSIAKCKYYINALDQSNSSGELACLSEQLKYLLQSEDLKIGTVF